MNDLTALLLSMGHNDVREKYLKLPFAYPGSKGEQIKEILPHLPYGKAYCEPFGGSGALLLNRQISDLEIYNDRYGGITHFFRVVRDPSRLPRFMERVAATVHSREEFIWCKETWKDCTDDVERAARWYYTIRFAINGKVKSTFGRSKDPVVRYADRLIKSLPLFYPLHSRLRHVTIENLDWRQCLDDYDRPGMVWYLDPTYLDSYPGTYDHELSVDDHKELIARIPRLNGFVAVSGFDGPQTRKIYDVAGLWDDVIEWERRGMGQPLANTETNHQTDTFRGTVKEKLWLRRPR